MLASIGVTPSKTTTTRLRRQQGAVANIQRHKTGQHYRQHDETRKTTNSTTMLVYQQRQRLRDANGDNRNNLENININVQSY